MWLKTRTMWAITFRHRSIVSPNIFK